MPVSAVSVCLTVATLCTTGLVVVFTAIFLSDAAWGGVVSTCGVEAFAWASKARAAIPSSAWTSKQVRLETASTANSLLDNEYIFIPDDVHRACRVWRYRSCVGP